MDQILQYVATADRPNANGRIYSFSALLEAAFHVKFPLLGYMGMDGQSPENASHMVTSIVFEGDEMYARIQILDTPQGQVLKEMMNNVQLDYRLSGYGDVSDEGIVSNFSISSINAVEDGA